MVGCDWRAALLQHNNEILIQMNDDWHFDSQSVKHFSRTRLMSEMRQLVCEIFCKTAFGLQRKTKTNRHCCCRSVGSIQIKLKAQLVWMLAWCSVTQSEMVYECVDKLREEDPRWWEIFNCCRSSVFSLSRSSGRCDHMCAGGESRNSLSGYIYSLSVCNTRGRAGLFPGSASLPVFSFCECEQRDSWKDEWKHGEMNKPRSSDRALRYPEVLVFFPDTASTHWSWSLGQSSLWSGRRGLHWIQHWRGHCHATEAGLAVEEMFQIQRRTEAAEGCTETSGSGSQTGWRALSWSWRGPRCCSHTPCWETRPPASVTASCAASPVGR